MYDEIEDDNIFFFQHQAEYQDAITQGVPLLSKSSKGWIGLSNHGATCYLNSLIQCLYNDAEFRSIIFNASDHQKSLVLNELRRLFANLKLSNKQAISTKNLLNAFGWNKMQMFEQHDIHEFFSVLIDSLSMVSQDLNASISNHFQGKSKDILMCTTCSYCSESTSVFLNLSIDIPDKLEQDSDIPNDAKDNPETVQCDLIQLIKAQQQPETLDSDNKWECSKCGDRVQASKFQKFDSLPVNLLVHLKRFRFDPRTKRRRKLVTPIGFPEHLDANEVFNLPDNCSPSGEGKGSSVNQYRLYSIVLHSGTAMGGHYKAFIQPQPSGPWIECNDATVTELSTDTFNRVLWNTADGSTDMSIDGSLPTESIGKGSSRSYIQENVYLLMYKKSSEVTNEVRDEAGIPSELVAEVLQENKQFEVLQRLHSIRQQMICLEVYLGSNQVTTKPAQVMGKTVASDRKVCVYVPKTTPLSKTLETVVKKFQNEKLLEGSTVVSGVNTRLRRYNRGLHRVGETFGGREGDSLEDLGLEMNEVLLLEVRGANDLPFAEYHPKDMILHIQWWTPSPSSPPVAVAEEEGGEGNTWEVLVPGRDEATVADLRDTVLSILLRLSPSDCPLPFPPSRDQICLLHSDSLSTKELTNEEACLVKDLHIFPHARIVVDVAPSPSTYQDYSSPALADLETKRKLAKIFFNSLPMEAASEVPLVDESMPSNRDLYNKSLEVSLDRTLLEVKAMIAAELGIPDVVSFHLKRNATSAQFKDESKTLFQLSVVDQSVLHVQMGKGCKVGEHVLRFELDLSHPLAGVTEPPPMDCPVWKRVIETSDVKSLLLGPVVANEKWTVLQLKQAVFDTWPQLMNLSNLNDLAELRIPVEQVTPKSLNHLRLRDFKGGKQSGPLRDERLVGRCLLGLSDGRRMVLQVLDNEEKIGSDDIILTVRIASYEKKTLSLPYDVPIERSGTIRDLFDTLLKLFPHLKEEPSSDPASSLASDPAMSFTKVLPQTAYLSVAKGFSTGPPLTLKSALKLKWNDPVFFTDGLANGLDRPPLNLRDGSIIVVRSNADFERAQLNIRMRKIAAGIDPDAEVVASAGGGITAVRGKLRPGSRSSGRPGTGGGVRPGSGLGSRLRSSSSQNVVSGAVHRDIVIVEKGLKIQDTVVTAEDRSDRLPLSPVDKMQSNISLPPPI